MRYTFQAMICNPEHPGEGTVAISFPIPDCDYEEILSLLRDIHVGDTLKRDCQVEEITTDIPILGRLELTTVNIDELDYLAKRLESFDDYEIVQFQAVAYARGVCGIQDLINLTFCFQSVTVIDDFSDMVKVGRKHYMTIHGGHAPIEELEKLDCRQVAMDLFYGQEGTITPYGVLYDNDFSMEELYVGKAFPQYYYEPPIMEATFCGTGGKTAWLALPAPELYIERMVDRSGLDWTDCKTIRFDSVLPDEIDAAIDFKLDGVKEINRVCSELQYLSEKEMVKLSAMVSLAKPQNALELYHLVCNHDLFEFYPGIHNSESMGRYLIQESGHFEYDPELEDYYNYEKYGADWLAERVTKESLSGIVVYNGAQAIEELMKENGEEKPFQMEELY